MTAHTFYSTNNQFSYKSYFFSLHFSRMNTSRLDHLPVELAHHLLGYFSAHEIFYSFANVTSYIDAVLATYTNYRVNFKAISRNNFDLVCRYIIPDQVIALTLSDDEDTPGLIGLFLSQFQIHQFTRLQALTLFEIGPDFWTNIIAQIVSLKYLRSFLYYPSNRSEPWICNLSPNEVTQLDKSLFSVYAPILPQLSRLRLCHGDYLGSTLFPCLRHLVLERSTINLINHISSVAPHLKSLDTSFTFHSFQTESIHPLPQLNHLVLRVEGKNLKVENISIVFPSLGTWISMNWIEHMMTNLPRLRHLELIADGIDDIINGQRWERSARNLCTLKFNFYIRYPVEVQDLGSFQTPFWIKDKRWFVAFSNERFFSVPHYMTTKVDGDFQFPQYTTVPDLEIFYRHLDTLVWTEISRYPTNRFLQVRTLILRSNTSLRGIRKVIDLCLIKHLSISVPEKHWSIQSLLDQMPNLSQLSIVGYIANFIKQVSPLSLNKIQTLSIRTLCLDHNEYNMEPLCDILPNVRHLHINHPCLAEQIFRFLRQFKYLATASFYIADWNANNVPESRLYIQSSIDQMRRTHALNFTSRCDGKRVFFWI